jgi:hypothetical protein
VKEGEAEVVAPADEPLGRTLTVDGHGVGSDLHYIAGAGDDPA